LKAEKATKVPSQVMAETYRSGSQQQLKLCHSKAGFAPKPTLGWHRVLSLATPACGTRIVLFEVKMAASPRRYCVSSYK
jgi:hypothetical protein